MLTPNKTILLTCFFLFHIILYGQKNDIELKETLSPHHQVELKTYLHELDTVSTDIGFAKIYNNIAGLYIETSYYLKETQYDSIHFYAKKASSLVKNKTSIAARLEYLRSLNLLGSSYIDLGSKAEAFNCFNKTLKLTENIANPSDFYEMREWATTETAILYAEQENVEFAINKYKSLLEYIKKHQIDEKKISSIVFLKLADFYRQIESLDSAFVYANRAKEIASRNKLTFRVAMAYMEMASIKLKTQEYKVVDNFLIEAFNLLKKTQYIGLLAKYYKIKSVLADQSGDISQKLHYAEKAFQLLNKQKVNREYVITGRLLSEAYKEVGDYKKALEFLNKTIVVEDILTDNEEVKKNTLLEIKKRDNQIAFERTQRELEQSRGQMKNMVILVFFISLIVAVVSVFLIFKDWQKKIELAKVIIQKNQQLQEVNIAKSRLFTNISHELRTPLTLIIGPVDLILTVYNESLSTEVRKTLQTIRKNAKSLSNLVNDILNLSKLDTGKLTLKESNSNLSNILKDCIDNFAFIAQDKSIDFTYLLLPDSYVLIDADKLKKIINNLLSNAFKYTSQNGKIDFITTLKNNVLKIIVKDNGIGISEKDLPDIFSRYFQSHDTEKPLEGGSGIGLSLVKELVDLMQGEIRIKSELKIGTEAILTIPIKEAIYKNGEQLETSLDYQPLLSNNNLQTFTLPKQEQKINTVLIVEDTPDMLSYLINILKNDYKTITAKNGAEALALLQSIQVDLVISDIMMPIMDGYTFLETVKNDSSNYDIPFIMLTALSATDKKLKALTVGADDYLTKPFEPTELLARSYNLIERYNIRKKSKLEIADQEVIDSKKSKEPHISICEKSVPEKEVNSIADIKLIETIADIIEVNLENSDFKLSDLSTQVNLGERHLRRKIKMITGLSPKQFQQEIVLKKALILLENKTYSNVKAVALSVGVNNVTRFSDLFEKRFGKKPMSYLKY